MTHIVPSCKEAVMLFIERREAFMAEDVTRLGYSMSRIRKVIQDCREAGLCHIYRWRRVGPKSSPMMVLMGGPGVDRKPIPIKPELKRARRNEQARRYYRRQVLKNGIASRHRKTEYGLRSYKIDGVLNAIKNGKRFTARQAAEYAKVSPNHMGGLLKRARDAKFIVIVDWDTSIGGGTPIYGWREEDMEDVPRPARGYMKEKRQALKAHVQAYGWLYGQSQRV